ncbi:hypothetical protein D3C72_1547890 [compost metagenome]
MTNDTAHLIWIFHQSCYNREITFLITEVAQEFFDVRSFNQWMITIHDNNITFKLFWFCATNGVSRAQLFILREANATHRLNNLANQSLSMTYDHANLASTRAFRGLDHFFNHRTSSNRMQNFWKWRFHASTFTRSHYDHCQWSRHFFRHSMPSL